MEKKKHGNFKDKLGEIFITNEGYEIEIIQYTGSKNCTIKFNNNVVIKNKDYSKIVRGEIKNPYHKSVCSVGYLGVGKYNQKTHLKIYNVWASMLKRCYSDKYQEKQPTYKGVTVYEKWYNFQVFAEWFDSKWQPYMNSKWALDKDILIKGNKVYSSKTCCFVPNEINSIVLKHKSKRGKYPIGVNIHEDKFIGKLSINGKQIHLGLFDTIEEAFQAYKTAKEVYIKEMAEKWKEQITEQVYQALIDYKVEITD